MDYDRNCGNQRSMNQGLGLGLGQVNSDSKESSSGVQLLDRLEHVASRAYALVEKLEEQLSPAMLEKIPQPSEPGNSRNKPAFFARADNSLDGLEASLDNLRSISSRLDF